MLYYDRTDVSEGIDVNKTNKLKEYDICHYWYFLNKIFKFQSYLCYRQHDVLRMTMNLSDIAIISIKDCCIISGNTKSEAIDLMQVIDLTKKNGTL